MRQVFTCAELTFRGRGIGRDLLALHHIAPEAGFSGCAEVLFDAQGRSVAGRVMGDTSPDHPMHKRILHDVAHGRLTALKSAPHGVWSSLPSPAGQSQVGGRAPLGLVLPEAWDFASGYGYLGSLSAKDPCFAGLSEDVHLIWPHLCDAHPPVFLDVADPLRPKLLEQTACFMIDPDTGDIMGLEEDECPQESDAIAELCADAPQTPRYEPYRFDMMRQRGGDGYALDPGVYAGAPVWPGLPQVPYDPEAKAPMRFLCQIAVHPRARTAANALQTGVYHPGLEAMYFGEAGQIFVFLSHDQRRICLLGHGL